MGKRPEEGAGDSMGEDSAVRELLLGSSTSLLACCVPCISGVPCGVSCLVPYRVRCCASVLFCRVLRCAFCLVS